MSMAEENRGLESKVDKNGLLATAEELAHPPKVPSRHKWRREMATVSRGSLYSFYGRTKH